MSLINLRNYLNDIIIGRSDTIDLVLTALVADGHILIEDYPGSGKTTLAKALGQAIAPDSDCDSALIQPFRRVQFTPDLLPGDVLGVNVFEPNKAVFRFVPGPIFAHVLLADEINRTGPKVQAAFLECMAEKQVTIDNQTHKLDELFFVIATQNPLDLAGTYPLPLVQLDRFLLKIPMSYVDSENELTVLRKHNETKHALKHIKAVTTRKDILAARESAANLSLDPKIDEAIIAIVQSTRKNPKIQFGASTRSAIMFREVLKAWAIVKGKEHIDLDDIKYLAPFVFAHRIKFNPGAGDTKDALRELLEPHIESLLRRFYN